MSDTAIIAICSAVTSCVVALIPLLVALINNKHNKSLRKIEIYYEKKVIVFKEFLSAYGDYLGNPDAKLTSRLLAEKASQALLYATDEIRPILINLLDNISDSAGGLYPDDAMRLYRKLSHHISKEIAELEVKMNKFKNHVEKKQ